MARGGIYKSDVMRARDRLVAQGRHPSLDAIRIELGNTGSKSTIQRYLKEIEEEEGGKAGGKVALSESIRDLVLRLAERLQDEADQRIVQLQAQHADELRAVREASQVLESQVQALTKALEQARGEIAAETERRETLAARHAQQAQALAQAQQLAADLKIQLDAQEQHRASTEAKYADARRSLEHFRGAAKEQREGEARKHENQVQFLQQEIRNLQKSLTEAQAKFVQANEELARLTTELGMARRELNQAEQGKAQLANTVERLAATQADRDGLKVQLEAERRRAEELGAEVAREVGQRQQADARVRELEAQLLAAQARQESSEQIQAGIRSQLTELLRVAGSKAKPT